MSLEHKTVLVTGATDGIGKFTALGLAKLGARVLVHGRNRKKGEQVIAELRRESGNKSLELVLADLASLAEVRNLAQKVKGFGELHALINNAGVGAFERKESADGFELTFAVNHLAPFLLTSLLFEALKQSAPSRVITVSSQSHRTGKIHFDDLQLGQTFSGNRAYSQSKLANLLFTFELSKRLLGTGVSALAFDPGPTQTNMMQTIMLESRGLQKFLVNRLMPLLADDPRKVSEGLVWLASAPEPLKTPGGYYNKNKGRLRAARSARDEDVASRLWQVSETLVSKGSNPIRQNQVIPFQEVWP